MKRRLDGVLKCCRCLGAVYSTLDNVEKVSICYVCGGVVKAGTEVGLVP